MVVFNGATTGIIGQMGGTVWAACSMIRTKSNVTTRNRTRVSPLTARYGYRLRHGRSRNDGMTEVVTVLSVLIIEFASRYDRDAFL